MERRAITVTGIVQGVGFRPFVFALAARHQLHGFVQNQIGTVHIEVEGESQRLEQFLADLRHQAPAAAQLDDVTWHSVTLRGDGEFHIAESDTSAASPICLSPDLATCRDCLAELFDPTDRRYRYPFLNCAHCGPRLTIVCGAPYDRERTTMAAFPMCRECRAEYDDPSNRRFHAQPTACPVCGPRLELLRPDGERLETPDPLAHFAAAVLRGQIGALLGLGGFHLVCDATDEPAVRELRRRKHRDEKPLAIMVRDVEAARRLCCVDASEQALLESPQRPIVLLRRHGDGVVGGVAPGNPCLGVMLPYTPLHHLLIAAVEGRPLVMTSGNAADEPIAYRLDDAIPRLGPIADVFLTHNRPIRVRCDDSVTRCLDGVESLVRRSRGYAPRPQRLPRPCPRPLLAVGGQFKGVFALACERQAFLSHHLGDLDHLEAYRAFERDVRLYEELFRITPELLVHDLHPDYASTNYARERADREGLPCLAVQHHHAHMASCMAEHELDEPVIGVTFDGTGFGIDEATGAATIWGGEFLVGDYREFRRAARLRYVGLPGGDRAIREPWRMALSHLVDAGSDLPEWRARLSPSQTGPVETMLQRRFNTPLTSSQGRLFDAVASLAGVRDVVSYEGQAAMELEWLASAAASSTAYPVAIDTASTPSLPDVIDTRPIIAGVVDDVRHRVDRHTIARRFHTTLVEVIAAVCRRIRESRRLNAVVLSGGVFLNALLTREAHARLTAEGFRVFRHRLVPPNDAGLSLGQAAIAAARSPSPTG